MIDLLIRPNRGAWESIKMNKALGVIAFLRDPDSRESDSTRFLDQGERSRSINSDIRGLRLQMSAFRISAFALVVFLASCA